jgi:hypothetical protein
MDLRRARLQGDPGRGEFFPASRPSTIFLGCLLRARAQRVCLHLLEIPAGVSSNPHYHEAHETAIFVLERAAEKSSRPEP